MQNTLSQIPEICFALIGHLSARNLFLQHGIKGHNNNIHMRSHGLGVFLGCMELIHCRGSHTPAYASSTPSRTNPPIQPPNPLNQQGPHFHENTSSHVTLTPSNHLQPFQPTDLPDPKRDRGSAGGTVATAIFGRTLRRGSTGDLSLLKDLRRGPRGPSRTAKWHPTHIQPSLLGWRPSLLGWRPPLQRYIAMHPPSPTIIAQASSPATSWSA